MLALLACQEELRGPDTSRSNFSEEVPEGRLVVCKWQNFVQGRTGWIPSGIILRRVFRVSSRLMSAT